MLARAAEHLFSYGTLRQLEVQRSTFARVLPTSDDALSNYRLMTKHAPQAPGFSRGTIVTNRLIPVTDSRPSGCEELIVTRTIFLGDRGLS